MPKKSIFIGCASENQSAAERLIQCLPQGCEPLPWWIMKDHAAGQTIIQHLTHLSSSVDGAAFVFGNDDLRVLKGGPFANSVDDDSTKDLHRNVPRDNVVLEYGMFAGRLGPERTPIFLTADANKIKLPTDIKGIISGSLTADDATIRSALNNAFHSKQTKNNDGFELLHISTNLTRKLVEHKVGNWISRGMYRGHSGARYWTAVEEDPEYWGHQGAQAVRDLIRKMKNAHFADGVDWLISFGPGAGIIDSDLASDFVTGHGGYVPVDINSYLTAKAMSRVDETCTGVEVPFGIVADFEESMSQIRNLLDRTTRGRGMRMFLMLGNTFSNLERDIHVCLENLAACMTYKDFLLLDIFTAEDFWNLKNDHHYKMSNLPDAAKRWFAHGYLIRQGRGDDEQEILNYAKNIESILEVRPYPEDVNRFYISTKTKPRQDLMIINRHPYEKILEKLKEVFGVVACGKLPTRKDRVGRAVFLLSKDRQIQTANVS